MIDIEKELGEIAEMQKELNNGFNTAITTLISILIDKGIVTIEEFNKIYKETEKEINNDDV